MVDLLLEHGSYLGITLVLILTGCGLPLPEEVPIIAAGVASSLGKLNPWMALAACLVGALLGDCVLYAIGYHFGHNLMRAHPRLAHLLHAEREAKMERLVDRHGLKVLFLARFMVLIRGPVYLSIGILRQPFRKFLLFDAICASAVVSLFFGLSYAFGERVTKWIHNGELAITCVAVAAVAAVAIVLWIKRSKIAELLGTDDCNGAAAGVNCETASDSPAGDTGTAANNGAAANSAGAHGAAEKAPPERPNPGPSDSFKSTTLV